MRNTIQTGMPVFPGVSMRRNPKQRHRGRLKLAPGPNWNSKNEETLIFRQSSFEVTIPSNVADDSRKNLFPGTPLLAKAGRWGSKRFESECDPWSWPWTSPLLALSLQEALPYLLASLLAEHQREILWPHKKAQSFLNACLYWTPTRFEPNFGGHCWHHCNALATFLLDHTTTSVTNLLHDTISVFWGNTAGAQTFKILIPVFGHWQHLA